MQAGALEKSLAKLAKELAKAGEEREKGSAQQEATKAEFKALEDAAFHVLELVRTTQELLSAKGGELAAIRAEFEAKQKEVGIIRQVEVDIANELDLQRSGLREEGAALRGWAAKAKDYAKQLAEHDGEGGRGAGPGGGRGPLLSFLEGSAVLCGGSAATLPPLPSLPTHAPPARPAAQARSPRR